MPHSIIEEIAGLATGNVSHILAPKPMKMIGPVSWNIFEALGLRVIVVEDLRALAKARRNSNWRERRQTQIVAGMLTPA